MGDSTRCIIGLSIDAAPLAAILGLFWFFGPTSPRKGVRAWWRCVLVYRRDAKEEE